jgi:hypothetical protein
MELAQVVEALGDCVESLGKVVEELSNGVKGLTVRVDALEQVQVPPHLLEAARSMGERAGRIMDQQTAKTVTDFGSIHVEITPDPVLPDVSAAMRRFGEATEKTLESAKPKTRADAEEICIFWGVNDPEELSSEDPDEAIGDHLESLKREDWPETLSLHGFVRKKVEYNRKCGPLDQMLEELDDEYDGPDRDGTTPTKAMLAAEEAFIAAVLAEYKPWACEEVWQEGVNVLAWVTAHQPDWLATPKRRPPRSGTRSRRCARNRKTQLESIARGRYRVIPNTCDARTA